MNGHYLSPHFLNERNPRYWYTVKDGNFTDPSVWKSTWKNKKGVVVPPANSHIMFSHQVTINQSYIANSIYGEKGALVFDSTARTLTVNGDCQIYGGLNMSGSGSTAHQLVLNGFNNFIESTLFTSGTGSTVTYGSNFNQSVVNISYRNLRCLNAFKIQTSNLTIAGNLLCENNGWLDTNIFDLTINGNCISNNWNGLKIGSASTNILIKGLLDSSSEFSERGSLDNSINASIIFEGGFRVSHARTPYVWNTGTGIFYFRTNNQILSGSNTLSPINASIVIQSGITLEVKNIGTTTTPNGHANEAVVLNGSINGTATETLLVNIRNLHIRSAIAPMIDGVLDANTYSNKIYYNRSGNQDVKGGTYRTLEFGGSGVKKLLGNIVINTAAGGSVSRTGTATIDYNGFDIRDSLGNILTP